MRSSSTLRLRSLVRAMPIWISSFSRWVSGGVGVVIAVVILATVRGKLCATLRGKQVNDCINCGLTNMLVAGIVPEWAISLQLVAFLTAARIVARWITYW